MADAPLWMPGAAVVKALNDGGSMTGSDAYVTWHTFECDYSVSALVGARALNAAGNSVTLCFHPITGDVVQMIPANRAGRGLLNEAGGVETNRQGRVNVQIEVIGRASSPWTRDLTAKGRVGLARILAWLDALGVPRTAPNGFTGPVSYAASTKRARSVKAWNGPGGYFCHADVPENDHWDHGGIDMRDLWAVAPTQSEEDDMALTDDDLDKIALRVWGYVNKNVTYRDAYAHLTGTATEVWKVLIGNPAKPAGSLLGGPVQVTASDIAAAIPDDIAQQVVDALAGRLNTTK